MTHLVGRLMSQLLYLCVFLIVNFSIVKFLYAVPLDSAFTKVPSRFESKELTMSSRGLGEICVSREYMPDGTACNAATVHTIDDSSLLARVFLGNGYTAINTAHKFLFKTLSRDFLQNLFENQNVTSLEANVGLVFTTKHFFASFSPYRIQYLSEVHNPNFPVIAVHGSLERSFVVGGGTDLSLIDPALKDFSVGLKTRVLFRQYVDGSFSLAQVLTEEANSLLPVNTQRAILFDPALSWKPTDFYWDFRISVIMKNIGGTWPEDPLYPEKVDVDLGFGIRPPVGFGTWNIGLDLANLVHSQGLLSRVRVGTSYKVGMIEPMLGWNKDSVTGGMLFSLKILQAGIVYELWRNDLGDANIESKIATEVSIRL